MEHAQRDNENRFNMKTLFYVLILILMEHAQRDMEAITYYAVKGMMS